MTRLTERETNLIMRARNKLGAALLDVNSAILEARRLRAEFMAEHIGRALRALARWTRLDEVARHGADAVIRPLRKAMMKSRTVRELRGLDDRMLLDIGLTRGDVEVFAGTLVEKKLAAGPAGPSLRERLATWLQRRRTIARLEALDDRLLADIGLERGRIAASVDLALAGGAKAARRETAVDRTYGALRQWNLSRQAATEIGNLGPDVLSDLGYVKGDVDWAPEPPARRRITTGQAA